jgi:ParB-like chromosome segregation protein Spo0J
MRRVPVVVRPFEDDEHARAYAIEDNLFSAPTSSCLSLAHMIVLARALKECGGDCTPQQVWEAAGVSPSTYWRAARCVELALGEAAGKLAGLSEGDTARVVAEVVRRGLNPQFALLLAGEIEINTFAAREPRSAGRKEKKRPDKVKASETARVHSGVRKRPVGPSGQDAAPTESGHRRRTKRGGKVSDQPLFEGLLG